MFLVNISYCSVIYDDDPFAFSLFFSFFFLLNFEYLFQVKGMITDFGEDMHCQFLEIIRILIESFAVSGSQVPLYY